MAFAAFDKASTSSAFLKARGSAPRRTLSAFKSCGARSTHSDDAAAKGQTAGRQNHPYYDAGRGQGSLIANSIPGVFNAAMETALEEG